MNDLEAFVVLNNLSYLGPVLARKLIEAFGSPLKALNVPLEKIESFPKISKKALQALADWKTNPAWQEDLRLIEKESVSILPYTHSLYPKELHNLPDAPLMLYVKGELTGDLQKSLAIVGTRSATQYGQEMAYNIAKQLAASDFLIISGLARGIDTAAHRGAISSGKTWAIIGSGLANLYPKENQALSAEIAKEGAVISELPMQTPPSKHTFPKRNRIVCGLAKATLLIEAPLKSGAMITSEMALKLQKKLFVLPGRVDNPNFKGNHSLLKNNKGQLIENGEDIACFLGESIVKLTVSSSSFLSSLEKKILETFPSEEVSIEELYTLTSIPITSLNVALMGLVLKKAIRELPGKMYKKVTN